MRIQVFINDCLVGDFREEVMKNAFFDIFKQYWFDEWDTIRIEKFVEVKYEEKQTEQREEIKN